MEFGEAGVYIIGLSAAAAVGCLLAKDRIMAETFVTGCIFFGVIEIVYYLFR